MCRAGFDWFLMPSAAICCTRPRRTMTNPVPKGRLIFDGPGHLCETVRKRWPKHDVFSKTYQCNFCFGLPVALCSGTPAIFPVQGCFQKEDVLDSFLWHGARPCIFSVASTSPWFYFYFSRARVCDAITPLHPPRTNIITN